MMPLEEWIAAESAFAGTAMLGAIFRRAGA